MWPSTWQFGWFQNIDVCNNETHINTYWLHPKSSWTHRALPSSGCNIWTMFRLVTGRLKWLSCGKCHLIFQQLIPWPQTLNEIVINLCKMWIIWKKNIPIVQTLHMNYHCYQKFQLNINITYYMIWLSSRWSLKTSGGFDLPVVLAYVRHSYWYSCSQAVSPQTNTQEITSVHYQTREQYIEPLQESIMMSLILVSW